MHELGWFSCPSAFGATPRPAPAYPCVHSSVFDVYGSHCAALKKGGPKLGQPHGRPTKGWRPSIKAGAQGAQGTPLAQVLLVLLRVLPSSALLVLVSLQVHKKKKKKRFPSFAFSFAFRVYLLPFTRTCLWWYNYPARTVLWCIIAHKNDFVERYHPQEWFLWEATMPHKDY